MDEDKSLYANDNLTSDQRLELLIKDIQLYVRTIRELKSEISRCKYYTPDVSKKDAFATTSCECVASGEISCQAATSTPNNSLEMLSVDPDISIIEQTMADPILIKSDLTFPNAENIVDDDEIVRLLECQCKISDTRSQTSRDDVITNTSKAPPLKTLVDALKKELKEDLTSAQRLDDVDQIENCIENRMHNSMDNTSHHESKVEISPAARESAETSSGADSGSAPCGSDRLQYYRNKLRATTRIVQNHKATMQVQAQSLKIAEERITALNQRNDQLMTDRNIAYKKIRTLQDDIEKLKVQKTDAAVWVQEEEQKKRVVKNLQENLSVIQELYRDNFYEAAKQEELVEMLRKSCLDVRLMDGLRCDEIRRLGGVVRAQRSSLERCQDIATEVDGLKADISNFLNSSNNDSGMWERGEDSLPADVAEDLLEITDLLLRLQDLLKSDCTCGLLDENNNLKENNNKLNSQLEELTKKVIELETTLKDKEAMDEQNKKQIQDKILELSDVKKQLTVLEEVSKGRNEDCRNLERRLRDTQATLEDREKTLTQMQSKCTVQELRIQKLTHELETAQTKNTEMHEEVMRLSDEEEVWQRRLLTAEKMCREKEKFAASLKDQLEEAQRMGAILCKESYKAVKDVRHTLSQKNNRIKDLEAKLIREQSNSSGPCSSRCPCRSLHHEFNSEVVDRSIGRTSSVCSSRIRLETSTVAKEGGRQYMPERKGTSASGMTIRSHNAFDASEIASCSHGTCETDKASVSNPKRRKIPHCGDKRCRWPQAECAGAGTQAPERRHRGTHAGGSAGCSHRPRAPSECLSVPEVELLERVECLSEALLDNQQRWSRTRL